MTDEYVQKAEAITERMRALANRLTELHDPSPQDLGATVREFASLCDEQTGTMAAGCKAQREFMRQQWRALEAWQAAYADKMLSTGTIEKLAAEGLPRRALASVEAMSPEEMVLTMKRELQSFGGDVAIGAVEDDGGYHVRLMTQMYQYSISVQHGYMGCIASEIASSKGRDLYDGELSLDTWSRILADIVAFEIAP